MFRVKATPTIHCKHTDVIHSLQFCSPVSAHGAQQRSSNVWMTSDPEFTPFTVKEILIWRVLNLKLNHQTTRFNHDLNKMLKQAFFNWSSWNINLENSCCCCWAHFKTCIVVRMSVWNIWMKVDLIGRIFGGGKLNKRLKYRTIIRLLNGCVAHYRLRLTSCFLCTANINGNNIIKSCSSSKTYQI